MYISASMLAVPMGWQKKISDSQGESCIWLATMQVLGIELRSSRRAASARSC